MKRYLFVAIVTALVCMAATTTPRAGDGITTTPDSTIFIVPANFPQPVYRFTDNPLTEAGFTLGRQLFYDPLLSKDGSISCGNCHQSFAAFANLDHSVSHGMDFCLGTRNAPALFNLAWQKEFMWDGGVKHIEVSPLNAITSSCEMASSLDTITERLKKSPAYVKLFGQAFGNGEINSQKVLRALAQFMSMLVSANSKYDKHVRNEPGGEFSANEEQGYLLFKQHCSNCHAEPLFTDLSFRNNGLDLVSEDPGRDTITNNPADRGKFRVPSLRNIMLTPPYMHDGRLGTPEEVLEHYNSGMKQNGNLDVLFRKETPPGIRLTIQEQKLLIGFLQTLTDTEFVNNSKFHEPAPLK